MSTQGRHLRELYWKQPLRPDEIALLAANLLDEHPMVAVRTLRAIVRLSLTPRGWGHVAANALHLLRRSSSFDDEMREQVIVQACRIPNPAIRRELCRMLEEPLAQPLLGTLLEALASKGEPAVVPHLLRALGSKEPSERFAASRELSRFARLPHVMLLHRLAEERHLPTRFWLALTLAVDGTPEPLFAFFDERRPSEYQNWGTAVCRDDSLYFILAERAKCLPAPVRQRIGTIKLRDGDSAVELQRTLVQSESAPAHDTVDPEVVEEPSEAEIAEATRMVERWIKVGPDWDSDVQIIWHNRRLRHALSHVDARLRGRAVAIVFSYQFAQLRSGNPRAFEYGMDGGELIALTVGSILEGARAIDVDQLFHLFLGNEREPVYTQIQLATAATAASPREVLVTCSDALQSSDPEVRGAAATFVELACRYAGSWIPTWGGESGAPDVQSAENVAESEQTETLLFDPHIDVPPSVAPGERIRILVDLVDSPDAAANVRLDGVSAQWETLVVNVSLVAEKIKFPQGRDAGIIELHRNAPSTPYEVEGVVGSNAGPDDIQVVALFSFRGRTAGWARVRIGVGAKPPEPTHLSVPIAIATEAKVAPLTLRLLREDGGDVYTYEVLTTEEFKNVDGMPQQSMGSTRMLRSEIATICDSIDEIARMSRPEQAFASLNGIADLIYRQLPQAFRDAYCAIRAKIGDDFPIQFITDDPGIPWELARPRDGNSRMNILCTTHPIARWHPNQYPPVRSNLQLGGTLLTIAPQYSGKQALPGAQEEALFMTKLGAKKMAKPSRNNFLAALQGERLSVLHIAAHAKFDARKPMLSELSLQGKDVVSAAEIRGKAKNALESGLVILNVCEGAAAAGQLGGAVVGLAESFLEFGAAAVIAPLWSIPDREALEMTQRYLPRMLKRSPIAWVLRDARHGDTPSIHPLGYLLWGDVTAAFQ